MKGTCDRRSHMVMQLTRPHNGWAPHEKGPGCLKWVPLGCEIDRENDGRWIADFPSIPGALAYGKTADEAIEKAIKIAGEREGASRK